MNKLCFSCFKRIPIFAGRCPYCLSNRQGVFGRIVIGIAIIVGIIFAANVCIKPANTQTDQNIEEILKELNK